MQFEFNQWDLNQQMAIFAKQRLEMEGASRLSFLVFHIWNLILARCQNGKYFKRKNVNMY